MKRIYIKRAITGSDILFAKIDVFEIIFNEMREEILKIISEEAGLKIQDGVFIITIEFQQNEKDTTY